MLKDSRVKEQCHSVASSLSDRMRLGFMTRRVSRADYKEDGVLSRVRKRPMSRSASMWRNRQRDQGGGGCWLSFKGPVWEAEKDSRWWFGKVGCQTSFTVFLLKHLRKPSKRMCAGG